MASIVTRAGKGSPLTNAEVDANFTNLNTELGTKASAAELAAINAGATISDTPPDAPDDGDLWWDSSAGAGVLKLYFNDGSSSQWVDANSVVGSPSNGSSPYAGQYVLSGTTTDATETEVFVGGVSGVRIGLTDNKVTAYVIQIAARRTDGTAVEAAFFELRSVASRTSGVSVDQGNVHETVVFRSDIGFNVDARADNATDTLRVYVTGVAGKTMAWNAVACTIEV